MTGNQSGMEAFAVGAAIRGGPRAASRARQLMRRELAGRVPDRLMDDIALLLTELVANGVRHAGAREDDRLGLRFERRPACVRIEVANPDHASAAVARRPPDLAAGGGLGLHIVDRLSSRWGVRDDPRTAVWFELDCEPGNLL